MYYSMATGELFFKGKAVQKETCLILVTSNLKFTCLAGGHRYHAWRSWSYLGQLGSQHSHSFHQLLAQAAIYPRPVNFTS